MKRVYKAKTVIESWEGKPLKAMIADDPFDEDSQAKMGELTIFAAMMAVSSVQVVGQEQLCKTLEDSDHKKALRMALKESVKTGKIELNAEAYKYLKYAAERVCPIMWQDNGREVADILTEGFAKENDPPKSKGKTQGKKEKDDSPGTEQSESRIEEE